MSTGTNNLTDLPRSDDIKFWNFIGYAVLFFIMAGQALTVVNILAGTLCYFICNILAVWRVFALNRPRADKVKDIACMGITVTIFIVKFL
jgi:hypothetical protein